MKERLIVFFIGYQPLPDSRHGVAPRRAPTGHTDPPSCVRFGGTESGNYKLPPGLGKSLRPAPWRLTGLSKDLSLFTEFARRRGDNGFRIDVNFFARREGSFDVFLAYEIHRAAPVALTLIN